MPLSEPQVDAELLRVLLEAREPLPLEAIGRAVGASPMQAARGIVHLQAAGCTLDRHPQHGVRLLETSLTCWSTYIESRHAGRIGRRLSVYRATTSTQDVARKLLHPATGDHHGHVLVTDHQSAGRGRLGRRWTTAPGAALLLTAIAARHNATLDRLMLAACTALAETVESLTGAATQVRWPNDLLIDGRKLAGIIVETVGPTALIGVGVNVHASPRSNGHAALRSPATSIAEQGPRVDRLLLLDRLLSHLQQTLYERPTEALHDAWRRRAALLQQRVTVDAQGRRLTGRVIDLDPAEGLLLQLDRGQVLTLPAATTSLVLD